MNDAVAQREMPKWKCHKEVHALKIAALEVHSDGSATIVPSDGGEYAPFEVDADWVSRFKGGSDDPGYYIAYADGYKSWSPADAFEEGYTQIS